MESRDLKRGTRRARTEAIKQTRMRLGYHGYRLAPAKWHETAYDGRTGGRLRNAPQMCSCRACGNQRAHEGPKPSERSHWALAQTEAEVEDVF